MKIPDWHIYTCPKCKEEWAVGYDFDCPHCRIPTIRGSKCNKLGHDVKKGKK